jgi:hypothetical protein
LNLFGYKPLKISGFGESDCFDNEGLRGEAEITGTQGIIESELPMQGLCWCLVGYDSIFP